MGRQRSEKKKRALPNGSHTIGEVSKLRQATDSRRKVPHHVLRTSSQGRRYRPGGSEVPFAWAAPVFSGPVDRGEITPPRSTNLPWLADPLARRHRTSPAERSPKRSKTMGRASARSQRRVARQRTARSQVHHVVCASREAGDPRAHGAQRVALQPERLRRIGILGLCCLPSIVGRVVSLPDWSIPP